MLDAREGLVTNITDLFVTNPLCAGLGAVLAGEVADVYAPDGDAVDGFGGERHGCIRGQVGHDALEAVELPGGVGNGHDGPVPMMLRYANEYAQE